MYIYIYIFIFAYVYIHIHIQLTAALRLIESLNIYNLSPEDFLGRSFGPPGALCGPLVGGPEIS